MYQRSRSGEYRRVHRDRTERPNRRCRGRPPESLVARICDKHGRRIVSGQVTVDDSKPMVEKSNLAIGRKPADQATPGEATGVNGKLVLCRNLAPRTTQLRGGLR